MNRRALLVFSALALALAGCSHFDPKPPDTPGGTPSGQSSTSPTPEPPRDTGSIYVVNKTAKGDQDPLSPRTVSLRHSQTPARDAVEALLAAPDSPMPRGTALRGITIDGGVATLDFSQSPVDETHGEGSQSEALTALGRTLGQFPEITKFQIEVQGRPVRTFGEFTTDGPIDVSRPDAVQSAKRTGGGSQ